MNIKSPWKKESRSLNESENIERSLQESLNMSINAALSRKAAAMASEEGDEFGISYANYQVPPTPFRINGNDNEDEDDNNISRSTNQSIPLVRTPVHESDSDNDLRYHLTSPKTPT